MAGPGRPPKNRAEASGVDAKDAVSAACGHGAMAKLKGALRRLKPTPGDAKTDLLLVIASRLIMNDGNGVAAADVVAACAVPPADAWIRRTFGDGVAITPAMVETALRAAKDHFSRGKDALYHLAGWPLPRRAQCAVGASFVTDDRLGVTPTTPTKEGGGGGGGGGTGGKPAGGGKSKATPPRAGAKRKEREVEEGARVAATATATAATAATATAANADAAGAEPEKKKKKKEKAAAAKKNAGLPPKASSADAAATANASAPPPAAHNPHNVRVSVKFIGPPRQGSLYRDRVYHDGFQTTTVKDGKSVKIDYVVGDHVYALPGSEDEDLYIAQIDSVFEDRDGQFVDCVWLERAKDVATEIGPRAYKDCDFKPHDVLLCTNVNSNPIQSIEGKVDILTEEAYDAAVKATKDSGGGGGFVRETFRCRRALVARGKKKHASGGNVVPVLFEPGRGFRPKDPPAKGKAGRKKKK